MTLLLKKENIGLLEALGISLLGLAVILAVLALLMGIVYLMGYLLNRKKVKIEDKVEESETLLYANGSLGELKLIDTTEREAALIMAIVADKTNIPLNKLKFISIRNVKENN